jgi:hypothetical protein
MADALVLHRVAQGHVASAGMVVVELLARAVLAHDVREVARAKEVAVEIDTRVRVARLHASCSRSPRFTGVSSDATDRHRGRVDEARLGCWVGSTASATPAGLVLRLKAEAGRRTRQRACARRQWRRVRVDARRGGKTQIERCARVERRVLAVGWLCGRRRRRRWRRRYRGRRRRRWRCRRRRRRWRGQRRWRGRRRGRRRLARFEEVGRRREAGEQKVAPGGTARGDRVAHLEVIEDAARRRVSGAF